MGGESLISNTFAYHGSENLVKIVPFNTNVNANAEAILKGMEIINKNNNVRKIEPSKNGGIKTGVNERKKFKQGFGEKGTTSTNIDILA